MHDEKNWIMKSEKRTTMAIGYSIVITIRTGVLTKDLALLDVGPDTCLPQQLAHNSSEVRENLDVQS
jgi:hypothetical protein